MVKELLLTENPEAQPSIINDHQNLEIKTRGDLDFCRKLGLFATNIASALGEAERQRPIDLG